MRKAANCEYCMNYIYEEEYGYYICEMDLDEDEMVKFMTIRFGNVPIFVMGMNIKL